MDLAGSGSHVRTLIGLSAAALAVAAVVAVAPKSPAEPRPDWQPPTGYTLAETVPLDGDHTLRLWTGPSGWYVESLRSGRHHAGVGAKGDGAKGESGRYSVSPVLDGLVGQLPTAGAAAVAVGPARVRATVHSGVFLVPASVIGATDRVVAVTPLDLDGRPLARETLVAVAGRD
ncbi:hypothetical protein [Micromonospora sp. NPDC047074]|uniref:hypothetical protein n=1 Tax=Micromonospora sp. NPDC047074 TaxID=3154339 RepID=UPI0033F16073